MRQATHLSGSLSHFSVGGYLHCGEAARFGNSVIEGEWGNYLKADILAAIELAEGQQGNDGQDGHNSGQCGGSAVVAADDLLGKHEYAHHKARQNDAHRTFVILLRITFKRC